MSTRLPLGVTSTTAMRRVVITGGPGAGKTTVLTELAAMGHAIVEESARAIITERVASGLSPRPDPLSFAREILRRDVEKYAAQPDTPRWVFFDRSAVEAIGMLHDVSPLDRDDLQAMLAAYPFHRTVFVLPPWEAIYANDTERDQSFSEAVNVHARVVDWYCSCGYAVQEVPRLPARHRAVHIVQKLEGKSSFVERDDGD